ncbi:hypothetical protein [Mycoplasma tauri]|nr:hypothetical protein [Mycoplasma tauri]
MINKTSSIETLKKMIKILLSENINYSIGYKNYEEYLNNPNLFLKNDITLCLWHEDFYFLLKKYPNLFILPDKISQKTLAPFFIFDNSYISINLIVGTNDKKISQLYKTKNYKKLVYWGGSKNHFFHYLIGIKSKRILIYDILNMLKANRYEKFIILGKNIDEFKVFDNLNYNNRFKINAYNHEFLAFNEYKKTG